MHNLGVAADSGSIVVNGRTLRVTSPDRVVYPSDGVNKATVIGYYLRMAERLLPHLRRRPVTRIRWPGGVDEPRFFEKQVPPGTPAWIETLTLEHHAGLVMYPYAHDAATLAWFAQQNALELHVPQWRWHGELQRTDRLVLDLDPGPGTGLRECADVASWLKEQLDLDGLISVPVTSGSKGIHVYARWRASERAEATSQYAKALADAAVTAFPRRVTSSMVRMEREGKVLIDWSQNNPNKTTITPYSLRGQARPYVAMPRSWAELAEPDLRQLLLGEVLERLAEDDPLAFLL